jgi:hypothetical protein
MRKSRPRLELHLKSRKIIADGPEAIDAIRWPARFVIMAVAVGILASSICLVAAAVSVRALLGML